MEKDQDWLEVSFPGTEQKNIRTYQTGYIIYDLVGPMVTHRVIIDVALRPACTIEVNETLEHVKVLFREMDEYCDARLAEFDKEKR